jgi:hypothetical protein
VESSSALSFEVQAENEKYVIHLGTCFKIMCISYLMWISEPAWW